MIRFLAVLLALFTCACTCGASLDVDATTLAASAPEISSCTIPPVPSNIALTTYSYGADPAQVLDLALPTTPGPFPLVVLIHGGAFYKGSRTDLDPAALQLASLGYAAASIDYRLVCAPGGVGAPGCASNTWPAPIDDARAAVAWLEVNAPVKKHRIAALGTSAGAVLTQFLGTDPDVHAVVSFYGVSEYGMDGGGVANPDELGDASPAAMSSLLRVSPTTAPMLLLYGALDTTVPPSQDVALASALADAGVGARSVELADAGHGFPVLSGEAAYTRTDCATLAFLREHL